MNTIQEKNASITSLNTFDDNGTPSIAKHIIKNLGKVFAGNADVDVPHGVTVPNKVLSYSVTMQGGTSKSYVLPYYSGSSPLSVVSSVDKTTISLKAISASSWSSYDVILDMWYV